MLCVLKMTKNVVAWTAFINSVSSLLLIFLWQAAASVGPHPGPQDKYSELVSEYQ